MSDELDNKSAQQLGAALHGLRSDMADIKKMIATATAQIAFQDRIITNAIGKLTAAVDRFADRAERAMKLNRAVGHEIADGVVKVVKEATGEFPLHVEPEDEISARHIKLRWSTIGGAIVKYGPIVAKAIGIAAALSAAAAGVVWAAIKAVAHKL